MQTTIHAVAAPRRGRIVGLFLALLLQAGFVWALVAGLTMHDVIRFIDPIKVVITPTTKPPPQPPIAQDRIPERVFVPNPTIPPIDTGPRPTAPTQTDGTPLPPRGFTDHGPITLAATHTIPPYPPIEERLGHEGTVVLRLTIAPDGRVADAVVVRSSGFERLDQAARAWVTAHWRYQPAVRGGTAVPGAVTVGVQFNLRNAG